MKRDIRCFVLLLLVLPILGFGSIPEVSKKSYKARSADSGIVLVEVNWGRLWRCGPYENAQIVSFGFDRVGISKADNSPVDLLLESPGRIMVDPKFISYAILLPAGEYALSSFKIKVASSGFNVGYWGAGRTELFPNGKIEAGSFTVHPGEVVYIGNFWIERDSRGPVFWRFFTLKESFPADVKEYKTKYPYIDFSNVQYRLLKPASNHAIGVDYPEPNKSVDPTTTAVTPPAEQEPRQQ